MSIGKQEKLRREKYYATCGKNRKDGGAIKSYKRARYETNRLGKLGPASKVRTIDPSTIDLSKYES